MRLSKSFGKTLRDAPAEAELTSHKLLLRANYIRAIGAGIYAFMPFGYRVIRKIWEIMADEMDAIDGQEMWMPNLHPAALWQATGRWDSFDVLFKLEGSGGNREYALSATHEEVVVDLAQREIESYRDLPRMVYHISKKFRDETRPRGGLLRLREFIMKDAYTLDTGEEAFDEYYPSMLQAYVNIFERCGVQTVKIEADVGSMGGKTSHEFTVPHPQGEDTYIACTNCDYAANVEAAEFVREGVKPEVLGELTKVATPDSKTIAAVADFVGVPTSQTIKAVFYWWQPKYGIADGGRLIFALVRGDLDINEVKLVNAMGGGFLRAAVDEEIRAIGAVPGYASGVGLNAAAGIDQPGVMVVADTSIEYGGDYVVGANEEGYHYTGANYPRDFAVSVLADIAQAAAGHKCPRCGGRIESRRGIETGHCFKLGTRYSAAVGATYLDENGEAQPVYMGSYGIGLDRLMAVIVELHNDQDGIIWPDAVAPFQVHLVHIGKEGDGTREKAEALYQQLLDARVEVLFDDREGVGAGVKFKDADLIGVPWRVTLSSRSLEQGGVEVKRRNEADRAIMTIEDLLAAL